MYPNSLCNPFHNVERVSGKVGCVEDLSMFMKATAEPILPVAKRKIRCKSCRLWNDLSQVALVEVDELELLFRDPR